MRYAQIREMDISNGPGVRVSLFTQGCPFHCKGCFNESTWDFQGGEEFTNVEFDKIIELCSPDYISGLSILGGEPFILSNLSTLAALVYKFKLKYPSKTIWVWTGNLFEDLMKKYLENPSTYYFLKDIIMNVDVIVDGQFKIELADPKLKYKGSSNQRVIDVKQTLKKKGIVTL